MHTILLRSGLVLKMGWLDAYGDSDVPACAIEAIERACQVLAHSPFSCRKVGDSPFLRERIVPFGGTGYVARFEIRDDQQVLLGAVRYQYESDYH